MEGRGGHYSAWPRRSDFGDTPLPYEAARNGEYISPYSAPLQGLGQLDPGTLPNEQYPASQSLFDQPQFPVPSHGFTQPLIPRESFADLEGPGSPFTTTDYHNSFNRAFISSGPVVHEGFIPAPGNEDEYWLDPDILNDRDESLLEGSDGASSEYDSGFEAQELEEIGNRNDNSEDDADFEDDVDEGEVDQDEMAVDDDEDGGDEIVRRRRKSIARGGRPVGRPRGSGIARGGRGGRQPNVEEGRSRRGRPRKTPNGRRGRPPSNAKFQRAVKTTPEYRRLIQIAHDAHFKDDHQTAIEYATQAITLDPSIFNAHQLLSEIYADMGNEFKSLQVLIIGAPAARSTELWYNLIDRVEAIDPEEYPICNKRLKTDLILECLRWIIQLDKSDYEARRMKLDAESQLPNRESKCVFLSERMLKMRPYDAHVLMTMARTGTKDAKQTRLNLRRIIDSFDTSIEYFLAEDKPATSNFNWSLLNIYLDVLSRTGNYQHCLSRLKALSRWLQNRAHETYWDRWDDDREFDEDDVPRRKEAPQFSRRPGRQPGYGKLEDFPLEMRVKLGLFRMRLGPSHLKEAMVSVHFMNRSISPTDISVQSRLAFARRTRTQLSGL
jgi:general transcription factor 3C polypeptide 3 (transcription factor C subunit 4)